MHFVFNVAKGRVNELARLAPPNSALIVVALETAGLEADATLVDYDTLGDLLANNTEQTDLTRQELANVLVSVDDANDRQGVDADDVLWPSGTGNPVSKLLVCYDPDTTTGTDDDIIPLTAYDWMVGPVGVDITATFNAAGFFRAV